jgi:hypothetical protein
MYSSLTNLRKAVVAASIFFSATLSAQVPMIRLSMAGGNNNLDETVLYYQQGATAGFDNSYDAYKLTGPNPAPLIAQLYNSVLMQINGVNPVAQTFTMPVKVTTPVTATFTITASDYSFLPAGTCVKLNDLFTGQQVDIRTTPYTFVLSDTTSTPRFELAVTYNTMEIVTQLVKPGCELEKGMIIAQADSGLICDYIWSDTNGTVLRTALNRTMADTLTELDPGVYKVQMISSGGCAQGELELQLSQHVKPNALFFCADSICLNAGAQMQIQNLSTSATNYLWDFGDGMGVSTVDNPTYNYSDTGHYTVNLITYSATGCTDTASSEVLVYELMTTGIKNNTAGSSIQFIQVAANQYQLFFAGDPKGNFNAEVYDLNGRKLQSKRGLTGDTQTLFDFNDLAIGIYVLKCERDSGEVNSVKFLIQ